MQKLTAMALSLIIMISFLVCDEVSAQEIIQPSPWAAEGVNIFTNKGFMPSDFTFTYQEDISRGDFCKLVVHAYIKNMGYSDLDSFISSKLKSEFANYAYPFKDLNKNNTDDKYIFTANILGFINGVSNNKFDSTKLLTREQAAKILISVYEKMLGKAIYSNHSGLFDDDHQIADWAKNDVYLLKDLGIVKGMGGNRFSPKSNYTVEQAIITVLKLIDIYHNNSKTDNEPLSKAEQYKKDMIRMINEERAKAGVPPVRESSVCYDYADLRAEELVQRANHVRPDGSSCFSGIPAPYKRVAENIAAGYTLPKTAMYNLMRSKGHQKNILNPEYEEVSIGYHYEEGSKWTSYWIQIFYSPRD